MRTCRLAAPALDFHPFFLVNEDVVLIKKKG